MNVIERVKAVIDEFGFLAAPLLSKDISSFDDEQLAAAAEFFGKKIGLPQDSLNALLKAHRGLKEGMSIKDLLASGQFSTELQKLADLRSQTNAFCRCSSCGMCYETPDYFMAVSNRRVLTECPKCRHSNFTSVGEDDEEVH